MEQDALNVISEYIAKPQNMIIISCYAVGRISKGIPHVPDWTIPILVSMAGIVQGWYFLGGGEGIVQGFIYSAIAVFGHQSILQVIARANSSPEPESKAKDPNSTKI